MNNSTTIRTQDADRGRFFVSKFANDFDLRGPFGVRNEENRLTWTAWAKDGRDSMFRAVMDEFGNLVETIRG